jgi:hypothetical protein
LAEAALPTAGPVARRVALACSAAACVWALSFVFVCFLITILFPFVERGNRHDLCFHQAPS